ncbi:hypothetical protein EAF04_000285 [Stromatinia cepivora]|nr:hypothetical protein EAF04_000285 [Stromatinia cepivora]
MSPCSCCTHAASECSACTCCKDKVLTATPTALRTSPIPLSSHQSICIQPSRHSIASPAISTKTAMR